MCDTSATLLHVGANWVVMTVGCDWAIGNGGELLGTEQLRWGVVRYRTNAVGSC